MRASLMLAALALFAAAAAGTPAQAQAENERDDGIGAAPASPALAPTPPSASMPAGPGARLGCRDSGVKVSFESGSSELDINARGALNGVATWLKMRNGRTIEVPGLGEKSKQRAKKGSAQARGSAAERRATAIRDYLLGQGIEPERIGAVTDAGERARANGRTVALLTCDVPASANEESSAAAPLPPLTTLPDAPAPPEPPEVQPPPAPAEARPVAPPGPEPPAAAAPPGAAPPAAVAPPPEQGSVAPPPGPRGSVAPPPEPQFVEAPPFAPPPPPAPLPPPVAEPPVRFVAAPPVEPEPPLPDVPPPPPSDLPPSHLGIEATLGGGVVGFVDSGARAFVNTGGSWEARMTFGSRFPVAIEAAYVGTAQGIVALGLSSNAILLGNGAEATLRINLTTARLQPYLFGGGGFTHYQLTNTAVNTSSVRSTDDIGTVPTGVGMSVRLSKEFFVDVRGTYRFTFNDQMFATASALSGAGNAGLDTWNAIGRLGFEL